MPCSGVPSEVAGRVVVVDKVDPARERHQSAMACTGGDMVISTTRGGGARLNDTQINDESKTLSPDDFIDGKAKISAGKKRHALLVLA